jgi:hypothetical protein
MADRITLNVPVYMKLDGQSQIVLGGSTIDVASSAVFASNQISNVIPGGGNLSNGVHNWGVSNVRTKE